MDRVIRKAQRGVLKVFSKEAKDFALAGGTALELYYLHHRFSADLDFFSPKFAKKEIDGIVSALQKNIGQRIRQESEFVSPNKARVRFYAVPIKGSKRYLKIDFVEDVLFDKPDIERFEGVRVYSAKSIYLQKIGAIAGMRPEGDEVGREIMEGRKAARDVFDLYMLSQKILPLHRFLKGVPSLWQRGMVHWYRTFSRQELQLALLDMDIYDRKFNSKEMIFYLEDEIKKFIREVME